MACCSSITYSRLGTTAAIGKKRTTCHFVDQRFLLSTHSANQPAVLNQTRIHGRALVLVGSEWWVIKQTILRIEIGPKFHSPSALFQRNHRSKSTSHVKVQDHSQLILVPCKVSSNISQERKSERCVTKWSRIRNGNLNGFPICSLEILRVLKIVFRN